MCTHKHIHSSPFPLSRLALPNRFCCTLPLIIGLMIAIGKRRVDGCSWSSIVFKQLPSNQKKAASASPESLGEFGASKILCASILMSHSKSQGPHSFLTAAQTC